MNEQINSHYSWYDVGARKIKTFMKVRNDTFEIIDCFYSGLEILKIKKI